MVEQEVTVVGLRFRMKKEERAALAAALPIQVDVWREPGNKYDENALKVVGAEGEYDQVHLGYLPRTVAEVLAPKIDSDDWQVASAELMSLTPPDNNEGTVVLQLEDLR